MRSFRNKPVGWRNESHRHYLAAKGIKTKNNYYGLFSDVLEDKFKGREEQLKRVVDPARDKEAQARTKSVTEAAIIPATEAEVQQKAKQLRVRSKSRTLLNIMVDELGDNEASTFASVLVEREINDLRNRAEDLKESEKTLLRTLGKAKGKLDRNVSLRRVTTGPKAFRLEQQEREAVRIAVEDTMTPAEAEQITRGIGGQ